MELIEFKKILDGTGYPVAFRAFQSPQKPPYICYLTPETSQVFADGVVYYSSKKIELELYTANKDIKAERTLEKVLSDKKIAFEKSETYIGAENLYLTSYFAEI